MSKKIIGITIGPIVETISESKEIAKISNASYFFSKLMFDFLMNIENSGYKVITPTIDKNEKEIFLPDRALLEVKNAIAEDSEIENDLKSAYEAVINYGEIQELKEYINFNYIIDDVEEKNIVSIFSKLDGVELIKNFPASYETKKIQDIIQNYVERNVKLSKTYNINYKRTQASKSGYMAIVALDIDNMGKFSQKEIEDIKNISCAINKYIKELNQFLSRKNEGLVLYSAGDDVLAVLNPKNIFSFIEVACKKLNEIFNKFGNKSISVSFGIFICYGKYPIKEAIEMAQSLLFTYSKKKKNTATIRIEKHSGQSCQVELPELIKNNGDKNEYMEDFYLKNLRNEVNSVVENIGIEKMDLLNAIVEKISLNDFVFKEIVRDKSMISCYIDNLFDAEVGNDLQKKAKILNLLKELLFDICKDKNGEIFRINLEKVLTFFKILKFYSGR